MNRLLLRLKKTDQFKSVVRLYNAQSERDQKALLTQAS